MANRPCKLGKKKDPKTNLPFGICDIYFDLKVSQTNIWSVVSTHFFKNMLVNMGSSSPKIRIKIDPKKMETHHSDMGGVNPKMVGETPTNPWGFSY